MITKEEITKTVMAVISELFPFLLRSGANTNLLLLPETPLSIGEKLAFAKRRFAKDFITYAGYKESERYYGDLSFSLDYDLATEGKSLQARAGDFKSVTLVSPSVAVLKSLAQADETNPETALVLYALTHRRKVRVLTDFDLTDVTPGAFAKKLSDVYGAVADMGIEIVRITTAEEEALDPMAGFVNEQTVREAHKKRRREIVVSPKTVITPLARDTADELGIKLRVKL